MTDWFDPGEFEPDLPDFEDDTGYGENVPGRFRFLGDLIRALPPTFNSWLEGAAGKMTNPIWGELGGLISDVRAAYMDADNWLRQKFVSYWGYMQGLSFSVEEYDQRRIDAILRQGWEPRKVFADVSDIRQYVKNAAHLEWLAFIDADGLYHMFIRGSK